MLASTVVQLILRRPLRSRADFGDGYISEKNAITIAEGEPEEALFTVPDRYTEVAPSVLYGRGSGSQNDKYYWAHRPN